MPNMSYCRFRNTLDALVDCHDALTAILECDVTVDDARLSHDELPAARELVERCVYIVQQFSYATGTDDLDLIAQRIRKTLDAANLEFSASISDDEFSA